MNDDEPVALFGASFGAPSGVSAGADVLEPDESAMRRRLATLRLEHEDLDASVEALAMQPRPDMIRIARLKKKKLALRDEIVRLEEILVPDIIA